ncbi:hypothetical protein Tco_1503753 [Tanacetum coccineum]
MAVKHLVVLNHHVQAIHRSLPLEKSHPPKGVNSWRSRIERKIESEEKQNWIATFEISSTYLNLSSTKQCPITSTRLTQFNDIVGGKVLVSPNLKVRIGLHLLSVFVHCEIDQGSAILKKGLPKIRGTKDTA